jgi:flagellar hook-associated protein 1 FlgK
VSTFSGLNVGLSSLYAQRRGLELTGHNVANANTEGYSRQRVSLEADAGPLTPALHSVWHGSGNGVAVADVQRIRDVFLESRALEERGTEAELREGQMLLSRVEGILAEPSDAGIQSQLSDFWAGWDDVANHPTDLAARSQLLERAQTLANGLNTAVDRIQAQRGASQEQLAATVADVNSTAAAVADFNKAIMSASHAGLSTNDLSDQRDLLVQRLGSMAGVTVRSGEAGSVDVLLGGRALVTGKHSEALVAQQTAGAGGPSSVGWAFEGAPAVVGGNAGGLVQGINVVLPRYREGLLGIAQQLDTQVNAKHTAGFDQDGLAGGPFFALDATGRLGVVLSDPRKVAASSTPGGDAGGGNALKMADFDGAADGPDSAYRKLVVQLGVEAQSANRRVDIQANILGQIDAAREADSGVNLDEEMTNMLAFQRAYEGSARFLSAVDQMLETLINRTGLVGR